MPKAKPRLKNAIGKNQNFGKPYQKGAVRGFAAAPTSSKVSKKASQELQQKQHSSSKQRDAPSSQLTKTQPSIPGSAQRGEQLADTKRKWPKIPFTKQSTILLVGEGDFSYSASLARMGYRRVMATGYDDEETCLTKYARAQENVDKIRKVGGRCEFGVDAKHLGKRKVLRDGWRSLREVSIPTEETLDDEDGEELQDEEPEDVRESDRPGTGDKADDGWDAIIFNFPHVGGLSTDVNRQVRHNQELIVGFLKSALPLLARTSGLVLITTFEAHPYTLWNLRDLARHSGYKIERSWRFCWPQWHGYRHVRTLGDLDGGGGWKGEEREARTFCLRHRDWDGGPASKKSRGEESDSD